MRSVVFSGPGTFEVADRPRPKLQASTDVLIAVEACGICGTDLHIVEDPPGHHADAGVILGHELVGHVAELGTDARGLAIGDRVVVQPGVDCGSCGYCKAGIPSYCEEYTSLGITRDGALAEYVIVPSGQCHTIDPSIPREIAALCEPLSCVVNGIDQARPLAGEVAVIFGAGAIGLLFLEVLRANGVRSIVVEPAEARAAVAARMGARVVSDPSSDRLERELRALAPLGADIVVDAVGTQIGRAVRITRPQGRILLFGYNARALPEIPQHLVTRKEIEIYGTYVGEHQFPKAVQLLESGLVDLSPIVSDVIPLEDIESAFEILREGRASKVVISIRG